MIRDVKGWKITLDTPIADLEVSDRLKNALRGEKNSWEHNYGPATVGDFVVFSEREFLFIPNIGRKALMEWRDVIHALKNPDDLAKDEAAAEKKVLREVRAALNTIAGMHKTLAGQYAKLADIVAPMEVE